MVIFIEMVLGIIKTILVVQGLFAFWNLGLFLGERIVP